VIEKYLLGVAINHKSNVHRRISMHLFLKGNKVKKQISCHILLCLMVVIFGCMGPKTEKYPPQDGKYPSTIAQPTLEKNQSSNWNGSRNLEPGLDGNAILLFEDFETGNYAERWPVHWGKPVGAGTISAPTKYVFHGRRSGYLEAKKGRHESAGWGEYVPEIAIDDVAYLRLYLRLDDDFSMGWANQLKLFSIRGGATIENAYGGAGNIPTGRDKFSVTLAIDNWRKLHFYYYHPDQSIGWGDFTYCKTSFFRRAGLSPGKWYCIELMLKNNTPMQRDGQIRLWLDGRLVGKVEKLRFRDVSAVKIRRFTVENYFGGGTAMDTSPKDQRIYIDNLVVSRSPIGCLRISP